MSFDIFPCKDVLFGGFTDTVPHLWGQIPPKKTILGGIFKAKCAKYSNFNVIKAASWIPTKFYTMIMTTILEL